MWFQFNLIVMGQQQASRQVYWLSHTKSNKREVSNLEENDTWVGRTKLVANNKQLFSW